MEAEVTRKGILDCQVCVPEDWTNEQVKDFADSHYMCGTENGWFIREEGDDALDGDPERVSCLDRHGFVHIMMDA